MDVKFQRLENLKQVDCLFFGSSMVDAGLEPKAFEEKLVQAGGQQYKCMNMGFSGSMVETSGVLAKSLINWHPIKLIIWGISPIEMDRNFTDTRSVTQIPVFAFNNGKPGFEGWLFDTFSSPWYYAAIPHLLNSDYLKGQKEWDDLLDDRGVRVVNDIGQVQKGEQPIVLPDFQINPVDMDMLKSTIGQLQKRDIKVVFVEMPVHVDFYPYLVGGGDAVYRKEFLEPVQEYFKAAGVDFIQTQPAVTEIVNNTDWVNKNHLNFKGAEKFSAYVAQKIHDEGILK